MNTIFSTTLKAIGSALVAAMLLGAGAAQAEEVVIQQGNVLRINDMELDLDNDELDGLYDVIFAYGSGDALYGSIKPEFDLPPEELGFAIIQINNTLNLNSPVPTGASDAGQNHFYIPAFEYGDGALRRLVGYGSQNVSDILWEACETGEGCLSGIAVLQPNLNYAYAKIVSSDALPDDWTLTVIKEGDGAGTVTSSPSGINCGGTCSVSFDDGATVTLTLTASEGSVLGRVGGCDARQSTSCIVDMTQDRSVNVTFEKDKTGSLSIPGITGLVLED